MDLKALYIATIVALLLLPTGASKFQNDGEYDIFLSVEERNVGVALPPAADITSVSITADEPVWIDVAIVTREQGTDCQSRQNEFIAYEFRFKGDWYDYGLARVHRTGCTVTLADLTITDGLTFLSWAIPAEIKSGTVEFQLPRQAFESALQEIRFNTRYRECVAGYCDSVAIVSVLGDRAPTKGYYPDFDPVTGEWQ